MAFNLLEDKNKKVHFIGIGGISMSGLAEILLKYGYKVSGSDRTNSEIIEKLRKKGAEIFIGHSKDNIKNVDLAVYTAAISDDNEELVYCRENNIETMVRAEFLGSLMKGHHHSITISGTHGKTTTTSMFSHVILQEDLDPTILVGGELDIINGNVRAGSSDYFVTEACEYKASFLSFFPTVGIILNVDEDHMDYYKDINHIKNTFKKFIELIPEDGCLVANNDDKNLMDILPAGKCKVLTYGLNGGEFTAKDISYNNLGCASFTVVRNGEPLFKVSLNVPGRHNILNALSVCASSIFLGISYKSIAEGLNQYSGVHRRFEIKGVKNGVTIIDDYAHHPTEIRAFISAANHYPHKRIVGIFQPHTYTRLRALFDEFTTCFEGLDEIIFTDVYAAREKDPGDLNSKMLCDAVNKTGTKATYIKDFNEIVEYASKQLNDGDLFLTIGAGTVTDIGPMFLNQ